MRHASWLFVAAALCGGCSSEPNGHGCEVEASGKGAPLRGVHFEMLVSQIGYARIWLNDCNKSYFLAPGSQPALKGIYSTASTRVGDTGFSGTFDGEIVYLEAVQDPAVRITRVDHVQQMSSKDQDDLHDRFSGERMRPRNTNITF